MQTHGFFYTHTVVHQYFNWICVVYHPHSNISSLILDTVEKRCF